MAKQEDRGLPPDEKQKLYAALSRSTTTTTHDQHNEFMVEGNKILRELGEELGKIADGAKHAKYLGSAAVHIYETPITGIRFFITQCHASLNGVPETLASIAVDELRLEAMKNYGRGPRAEKKR